MNKKFFLFFISLFIGIILFIWVVKFVGWQKIKTAFLIFTLWQGIIILLLTFAKILTATWKWKGILKAEGVNVPFFALLESYLAGFSLMYFFPTAFLGGEIFQSYILKKKKSIPWSKGMASSISDQILDWTTNLVIIFFGMIFFLLKIPFLPKKIAIISFIIFPLSLFSISYFYFKAFKKESIMKFLLKHFSHNAQNAKALEIEKEIFNFFNFRKASFWKGIFLGFVGEIFFLLRVWFLVNFFGRNINLLSTISILGFSYLAMLIPIPAVLGIHEGVQTFVFESLKLGVGLGTAFTLVIRGADTILALIGIFISFRLGSGLLGKALLKNERKF